MGIEANSPNAKTAPQRRADEFMVNLPRVTDFSIQRMPADKQKAIKNSFRLGELAKIRYDIPG
jgi:hypothetical protein